MPLVAVLCLAWPSRGHAQQRESRFEVGVLGGTIQGVGAAFRCVTDHPVSFGVRGRFRPVDRLAIELGLDRIGRGDSGFCIEDPAVVPPEGLDMVFYGSDVFPFASASVRVAAWPLLTDRLSGRVHVGLVWMSRLGSIAPVFGGGLEVGRRPLRIVAEAEVVEYRYAETHFRLDVVNGQVISGPRSTRRGSDRVVAFRFGLAVALPSH